MQAAKEKTKDEKKKNAEDAGPQMCRLQEMRKSMSVASADR